MAVSAAQLILAGVEAVVDLLDHGAHFGLQIDLNLAAAEASVVHLAHFKPRMVQNLLIEVLSEHVSPILHFSLRQLDERLVAVVDDQIAAIDQVEQLLDGSGRVPGEGGLAVHPLEVERAPLYLHLV